MTSIIEKHENDFFAAYKLHMFRVEDEMKKLRKRTTNKYINAQKDIKINELENKVNFCTSELDNLLINNKILTTELNKNKLLNSDYKIELKN